MQTLLGAAWHLKSGGPSGRLESASPGLTALARFAESLVLSGVLNGSLCLDTLTFSSAGSPLLREGVLCLVGLRCGARLLTGGFSRRGAQALGPQAQGLWPSGFVTGSSWTRDRTRVPCVGGWILTHWTTREAQ